MWADNETDEDLLGFEIHANLVKSIVTDPAMLCEKRAVEYDAIRSEKSGGSAWFLHRGANGIAPLNNSPHFQSVRYTVHLQACDITPLPPDYVKPPGRENR